MDGEASGAGRGVGLLGAAAGVSMTLPFDGPATTGIEGAATGRGLAPGKMVPLRACGLLGMARGLVGTARGECGTAAITSQVAMTASVMR